MASTVSARTLREWLNDGSEIAVLDVRDGGPYSRGHILVASGVPRAVMETAVPRLLPRRSVRVVLTDEDGSTLAGAAALMESAGYTGVHLLEGGNAGWTAAGYRLFSGSNIVSKVFGEMVEEKCGTPHIDAATLTRWREEGRPFRLFDVRPAGEYRTVSIPGASNCPGMESVLRIPSHIDDPDMPVVVNCAGRTRSIIGAQSLREAGVTNPVFALENGTMGWQLAGFEPDHGQSNTITEPMGEDLRAARESAREVAARGGVRFVERGTVDAWLADPSRTTYVFDVRMPEAFALARFPGSQNAPGGQLIQSTDTYAAVRHARIVVVDEHLVQSVMTAHWLARMGWEAWVLGDPLDHLTEHGNERVSPLVPPDPRARAVEAAALLDPVAARECTVVDVGESYWYRQSRIPGSRYAMRSMLSAALDSLDRSTPLVFCCSTGSQAPYAAGDALEMGFTDVSWLVGGRSAWRHAGGPTETIGNDDDELLLTPTDDMWYPPWARAEGAREAMAEYLSWEVGLADRLRSEEYLRFSGEFDFIGG